MRPYPIWKNFIVFLMILFVLLVAVPVAGEALTSDPSKLTISIPGGNFETRTLLIMNNNEGPMTDLTTTSLDLNRDDSQAVFPSKNIEMSISEKNIPSKGFLKIPVSFNTQNIPSGDYSGSLLIATNNSRLLIPVNLKIKDSFLFPLFTCIICGIIGWGVIFYKTKLLKPNQLNNKRTKLLKKVRENIENEEKYTGAFRRKIETLLGKTKDFLENIQDDYDNNLKKAEEFYNEAENIWDKWEINHPTWKQYLDTTKRYEEKIENLQNRIKSDNPAEFIVDIRLELIKSWDNSANVPIENTPLKTIFDSIDKQVNVFGSILDQLDYLKKICIEHDSSQLSPCQDEVKNLRNKLCQIHFNETDSLNVLLKNVKDAINTFHSKRGLEPHFAVFKSPAIYGANISMDQIEPETIKSIFYSKLLGKIYECIVFAILPIIFIFLGLYFQYLQNPTFGANGLKDYASLGLWSFGVKPAFDSISQIVDFMK